MNDALLIERVYCAPLERRPWVDCLHELRRVLDSHSAQLMLALPSENSSAANIDVSHDASELMRNEYYREYWRLNPFRYDEMRPGCLYTLDDFVERPSFEQSHYFRAYCQLNQADHALSLYIGTAHGFRAWLNMARGAEIGEYSDAELDIVRRLAPHLQRAFGSYAALERSRAERDTCLRTIDNIYLATAIIDRTGRILMASPAARNILSSHACISVAGDRLVLKRPGEQRRFIERIGEVADGRNASYATQSTCDCEVEKTTIMLRRVDDTPDPRSVEKPAVIMHIRTAFQGTQQEVGCISSLFHLSRTEARFALLLSTGHTVDEIAGTLGITRQSARTYCKRIFAKTGARRQAQLVKLVLDNVAAIVH